MSPHGTCLVVVAALLPVTLAVTGPPITSITPMAVSFRSAVLRSCLDVGASSEVGGCWEIQIEATFTEGAFGSSDTQHMTDISMSGLDTPREETKVDVNLYRWIIPEDVLISPGGTQYSKELVFYFTESFTFTADMTQADTFSETVTVHLESSPVAAVSATSPVSDEDIVVFAVPRLFSVSTDLFIELEFLYSVEDEVDVSVDFAQSDVAIYCPADGNGPSTVFADECEEAEFAMNHTCQLTALDQGHRGALYFPVTDLQPPYSFDLLFTTNLNGGQGLQRLILSITPSGVGTIELCPDGIKASVDLLDQVSVTFYSGIGEDPPSQATSLDPVPGSNPVIDLQGGSVKSESLITMTVSSGGENFIANLIDVYIVYDWDTTESPGVTSTDMIVGVNSDFTLAFEDLTAAPFNCSASAGYVLSIDGDCSFYHSDGPTLDATHIRKNTDEIQTKNWIKDSFLALGTSAGVDGVLDAFYETVTSSSDDAWFIDPFADGYAREVYVNALFEILPTGDISGGRRLLQASTSSIDGATTAAISYDVTQKGFVAASLGVSEDFVSFWTLWLSTSSTEACMTVAALKIMVGGLIKESLGYTFTGDVQVMKLVLFDAANVDCESFGGRRLLADDESVAGTMTVDVMIIQGKDTENPKVDLGALLTTPGVISAVEREVSPESENVPSVEELPALAPEPVSGGSEEPTGEEASAGEQDSLPSVAMGCAVGVIVVSVGAAIYARRRAENRSRAYDDTLAEFSVTVTAEPAGLGTKLSASLEGATKPDAKLHPTLIDEVLFAERATMDTPPTPIAKLDSGLVNITLSQAVEVETHGVCVRVVPRDVARRNSGAEASINIPEGIVENKPGDYFM